MKFRVGRSVPRNIYLQLGDVPSHSDPDIGRIDDARLAKVIVLMLNEVNFNGTGVWEIHVLHAVERINRYHVEGE